MRAGILHASHDLQWEDYGQASEAGGPGCNCHMQNGGRRHFWLWPPLHERAPGPPEKNCSLEMEPGHAASLKHGAHK